MANEAEHSADEPSQTDTARFVVYCAPRTGSYHLTSLLDSAPDVVCHGELFKKDRMELRPSHKERLDKRGVKWRDNHPWAFIKKVKELDPERHFGFKLFREHARRVQRLKGILNGNGWKKIALLRDPVEVYASLLRAQASGQWIQKKAKESSPPSDLKVEFSQESFDNFKKFYFAFVKESLQHENNPSWLIVFYDDLNDPAKRQSILDFIGSSASAAALSTQYEKQYVRPLSEAFSNWDELVDSLNRDNAVKRLDWPRKAIWREPASQVASAPAD